MVTKVTYTPDEKIGINKLLEECLSFYVWGNQDFRLPKIRLCPVCDTICEATDKGVGKTGANCKYFINGCPNCQAKFCFCCLKTYTGSEFSSPCGPYDKPCPTPKAPRQKLL